MANPIKAVMDIRKGERAFSFLMLGYFFLVITTFWILKPLKKTGFFDFYENRTFDFLIWTFKDAQAEQWAKVANMFVAFFAVIIFTWLSKKFAKHILTIIYTCFFILCFALLTFSYNNQSELSVWIFYLFGDLYSTIMVATFFVFLNDSVTSESAKRLYGLVGIGGVLGGAVGSIIVRALISDRPMYLPWPIQKHIPLPLELSHAQWMILCILFGGLIVGIAQLAHKFAPAKTEITPPKMEEKTADSNPALDGAKLVFKSKYLFAIVSIVGLYEIVSTVVDYQFSATVSHFTSGKEKGETFATAYVYMNVFALLFQFFLTSYIMKFLGIRFALFILPAALILISGGFLALPILALAMFIPTSDGGLAYSVNQSAKESLYVPTTKDEKYKAKAFIDMFVQRFAKVLAIGVTLVVTSIFQDFSTVRWLSLGTVVIVVLWLIAVNYAGKQFDIKSEGKG